MASAITMLVADHMLAESLTAAEVARRGGLPMTTVAAIRDGSRGARTRPDTARKLARGLGLSEEVLLEAAGHVVQTPVPDEGLERQMLNSWRLMTGEDRELALAIVQTMVSVRGRQAISA